MENRSTVAVPSSSFPTKPTTSVVKKQGRSPLKSLGLWALLIAVGIAIKLGISTTAANYKLNQQERHSAPILAASPSTRRVLQPGDTWTYDLTATFQLPNGQVVKGSGKSNDTITTAIINGQNVLAENSDASIVVSGGRPFHTSATVYFVQNAAGDYQQVGDNNGPNHAIRLLTQPQTTWPGNWSNDTSVHTTLLYRGGSQGHTDMSVVAAGKMETAATGQKVMCWPLQGTDVDTDGTRTSSQALFAPQLGQAIQGDYEVPQANGARAEIKLTLVSDHLE